MQVNQRTAVINAVKAVVTNFTVGGGENLGNIITAEQKKQVRAMVVEGFLSGSISFSDSSKLGNHEYIAKYVSGLVDNWFRKAPELNGGNTYQAKNPGSRAGSGDDQIKALKALLKTVDDNEVKLEIQQAINSRLAEIKPAKTVEINVGALPEHLRHLVN